METTTLEKLTHHVRTLIRELEFARRENEALKNDLMNQAKKITVMQHKNEQAANKVKRVVRQLKESME